jgi:hypothetical protein
MAMRWRFVTAALVIGGAMNTASATPTGTDRSGSVMQAGVLGTAVRPLPSFEHRFRTGA